MYPHDYHDWEGHPFMHNRGEARPYIEPDIYASAHDAAIPVISTIGRGPKGNSITAALDDSGYLVIKDTDNEEVIARINMNPWEVSVTSNVPGAIDSGVESQFTITFTRGAEKRETTVAVPAGQAGSYIFATSSTIDASDFIDDFDGTLEFVYDYELAPRTLVLDNDSYTFYGSPTPSLKPRVGDILHTELIWNDGGILRGMVCWFVITEIDDDNKTMFMRTFAPAE